MYKLKDLQYAHMHEDLRFKTKKRVRRHLIAWHSQDRRDTYLRDMTLEDILIYGGWKIIKVN